MTDDARDVIARALSSAPITGSWEEADAILAALAAAGLVIAPLEPTRAMMTAGYMKHLEMAALEKGWSSKRNPEVIYRAMIAAGGDDV